MDARVRTAVMNELWKAKAELARAEVRREETPNLSSTWNTQMWNGKRVASARRLVEGWEYVASLLDAEPNDDVDADKEFPS